MSNLLRFSLVAAVSSVALLTAACSGPNPNSPRSIKDRLQPDKEVQKVMSEIGGPKIEGMDAAIQANAEQALATGKYKTAAQFYAQLIEKNPEKLEYKLALADALRKGGHYDEAESAYKKILAEEKLSEAEQLDVREGLGLAYMEDGEFDKAGDELASVMEKDAKRWRTLNAIGILFTTKQMYSEARQYFDEALVLDSQNIAVRNNLALMEALDSNHDEAIRLLSEAKSINGKRGSSVAQLDSNLALVYAIKGDLKMAEATIDPHLTEAQKLNNMGFYARLKGDDQLAKSYLSMALTKSEKYYDKAWKNLDTLNKLRDSAPAR
ncbi:MAG: tetratricopeptide repeat protein [Alphaproteobacteria bacterium]|nr:tetratricopeptide repeat protein [Alphaproteobacteria bacterium]